MTGSSDLPRLSVEVSQTSASIVVSISGEIDISNSDELAAALDRVVQRRPDRLVIDLAEVSFMGSAGIAILLAVSRQLPNVALRRPSPIIRRIIHVTGLEESLPMDEAE